MSYLKRGLSGEPVKILQAKLGLTADGSFGPRTETAVKDFQKSKGLAVDGIAGPDTFAALGLHELILLRQGASGAQVKKLQEALGISADGKFGPGTRKAVVEFQTKNGLTADGIAGPMTLSKLSAFAGDITPATVAAATLPADFVIEAPEPLPPLTSADVAASTTTVAAGKPVTAAASEPAPERSVWGTIKGWFS
jgi:peptidoglycan hydrolase-like protein with peptidoglycan-binding domain